MPDEARSPEWVSVDKAAEQVYITWRAYLAAYEALCMALRKVGATSQGSAVS